VLPPFTDEIWRADWQTVKRDSAFNYPHSLIVKGEREVATQVRIMTRDAHGQRSKSNFDIRSYGVIYVVFAITNHYSLFTLHRIEYKAQKY
jgi:hypothetical protein